MTIQGALSDLNNLLEADDIPFYYKPSIKKIIETIEQEPKLEKIEQIVSDYGLTNVNLLSDDLTDFEKDILREVLEQE